MSLKLIDECLQFPAIRREINDANIELPKNRERRERDEGRSSSLRSQFEKQRKSRHERGDLAHRDELERSIEELKKQLKLETRVAELRKLLIKRFRQSGYDINQTTICRAAISERDRLSFEILELHSRLHVLIEEEEACKVSHSKLLKENNVEDISTRQNKKRRIEEMSENQKTLESERGALKRLFFTLIMESGVEWLQDDILSSIVWSLK